MDKPLSQLFLEMRSCESLLRGSLRVPGTDNHSFIIEQLQRASVLMEEFNHIPNTDRYWQDECIADETYFALEIAVGLARKHIRSSFREVNRG